MCITGKRVCLPFLSNFLFLILFDALLLLFPLFLLRPRFQQESAVAEQIVSTLVGAAFGRGSSRWFSPQNSIAVNRKGKEMCKGLQCFWGNAQGRNRLPHRSVTVYALHRTRVASLVRPEQMKLWIAGYESSVNRAGSLQHKRT